MWITPDSAYRSRLHLLELVGRLAFAHTDAAQRMHYLGGRLALGVCGSCLRSNVLSRQDVLYAADRAQLEQRVMLMMEAGAEGCANILRSLIEESARAHIRCVEGLAGLRDQVQPLLRLGFAPATVLPFGRVPCFSAAE